MAGHAVTVTVNTARREPGYADFNRVGTMERTFVYNDEEEGDLAKKLDELGRQMALFLQATE